MGHAAAPSLFILSGAPGSGKTALLSPLRNGFRCVDEPAREVLAEQRATGGSGTWDQDPSLFVHLLLQRSIEKYEAARRSGETVIFDRGIPDCVDVRAIVRRHGHGGTRPIIWTTGPALPRRARPLRQSGITPAV